MSMTEAQYDRYTRHILLRDIGEAGQERLLASTVAIDIGPNTAAEVAAVVYLGAAGVGQIVLGGRCREPVTEAEIAPGLAYGPRDLGRPRLEAIRDRIEAVNPDVTVLESGGDTRVDARLEPVELPEGSESDLSIALVRGCAAATRLLAELSKCPG